MREWGWFEWGGGIKPKRKREKTHEHGQQSGDCEGRGVEGSGGGYGGKMVLDRELTWDGEHTIQRTDDVL